MAIQLIEAIWNTPDKKSICYVAKNEYNQTLNNIITDQHDDWDITIDKLGGPESIDQWTDRKKRMDEERAARGKAGLTAVMDQQKQLQDQIDQIRDMKANPSQLSDEEQKAAKLKELFTLKLEAFEIPEVKESENKDLRSRIRKATNSVEISALVGLIMAEALAPKKKAPKKKTS